MIKKELKGGKNEGRGGGGKKRIDERKIERNKVKGKIGNRMDGKK